MKTQSKTKNSPDKFFNSTLLVFVFISVSLLILLFDYVKPITTEPVSYLSYFIYLIGGIGLYIFYKYYFLVQKEEKCADLTHLEAQKILFAIKANGLEFHLHQFRELGTKQEELSVNRILSHVYTEAESKKFDSSLVILNAYKDEFASQVMRLFGFQKVALQIGILGTFIGLAMAFKDISGTNIDDKAIDHLLKSLRIPFSASIAGLQVAFILWLHIDYLQREHEKLFKIMEKCVDEVINLARHAIYKDSITVELQHVSSRMDELSGRIEKGNELLYSQNNQISQGVNRLRTANTDLDSFMNGIAEKQREFLASVKLLYESLSPELISKELKNSFSYGVEEISKVMSKHLSDTLSRYGEVEGAMVAMNSHFKELQLYMVAQVKQDDENLARHKEEIFECFTKMITVQKQYIEQLAKTDMKEEVKQIFAFFTDSISTELKSNFTELTPPISRLSQEMAKFNTLMERKNTQKKSFFSGLFNSIPSNGK